MKVAFHPVPEAQLKEAIKNMTLIVDTRENENNHIMDYIRAKKINYVIRKLDAGDYSLELPLRISGVPDVVSLEKRIVIERKHSIDEIATNLGKDSERFEREIIRLKAAGTKCVLLLENFSFDRLYGDVKSYRSQMPPDQIALRLNQHIVRYDLQLYTLNDRNHAGRLITSLLARHAYEYLKEA